MDATLVEHVSTCYRHTSRECKITSCVNVLAGHDLDSLEDLGEISEELLSGVCVHDQACTKREDELLTNRVASIFIRRLALASA